LSRNIDFAHTCVIASVAKQSHRRAHTLGLKIASLRSQ
jgi:hypothetical protein